jgi:hypothetical protein
MKKTIILVLALVLLLAGTTACDLFGGAKKVDWENGTITVSSAELSPAKTVPSGEFYNESFFGARPVMQAFKFETNGDWHFTITISGAIGTKVEVYTFFELRGGPADGYGYDHVFTMEEETVTVSRDRLMAEGQEPPVNVKVKVLSDAAISWEMVIEELVAEE